MGSDCDFPIIRLNRLVWKRGVDNGGEVRLLRWIVCLGLACGTCGVTADAGLENSYYTTGSASRDGIGKFYIGREISHVMGHLGAG